jgi:hypothetical protein
MGSVVDNSKLRQLAPPELAPYFMPTVEGASRRVDICSSVLCSGAGVIATHHMSVWLSIARTSATLLQALT